MNPGIHKRQGISRPFGQLLISQEVFGPVELVVQINAEATRVVTRQKDKIFCLN
jgi:hypothetical protein